MLAGRTFHLANTNSLDLAGQSSLFVAFLRLICRRENTLKDRPTQVGLTSS